MPYPSFMYLPNKVTLSSIPMLGQKLLGFEMFFFQTCPNRFDIVYGGSLEAAKRAACQESSSSGNKPLHYIMGDKRDSECGHHYSNSGWPIKFAISNFNIY